MAGDVAGVPHRGQVVVGSAAQRVTDLERRRLLPLEPVGVDRIDQHGRVPLGEDPGHLQGRVEVPVDLQQAGPVDQRLGHLPGGDLSGGNQDRAHDPRLGGVGGRRGAGVAGRRAYDHARPRLDRLGDGQGHPAVLEGARGVGAFELQIDLTSGRLRQGLGVDQRRTALRQRHHRRGRVHWQPVPVLLDDPSPRPGTRAGGRPLRRHGCGRSMSHRPITISSRYPIDFFE